MPKYVLDTNLYIFATRNEDWNRSLEAFYWSFAPFVYLHSVVASELLAGSIRSNLEQKTKARFIQPFESVGRVITPAHGTWKRAGRMIARLVRDRKLSGQGIKRSFFNDCILAASQRDHGFVLVTDNIPDFQLIGSVEPIEVLPPWP